LGLAKGPIGVSQGNSFLWVVILIPFNPISLGGRGWAILIYLAFPFNQIGKGVGRLGNSRFKPRKKPLP